MSDEIVLLPKRVFGLRADVTGNVHFKSHQEIVYPAAGVLVVEDITTNKQKYLRFPENTKPDFIVVSPNRKLLAVSEVNSASEKTLINIYDLENLKTLKSLSIPAQCSVQAVKCMSFTGNSRGLALLTSEPDAFLVMFSLEGNKKALITRASKLDDQSHHATMLHCNPQDKSIVAIGGANCLKLMVHEGNDFKILSGTLGEGTVITSLAFISADFVIAGSTELDLYFLEGGELKAKFHAVGLDVIDLNQIFDDDSCESEDDSSLQAKHPHPIMCLTSFPKGFAFAIHNTVHVFQREESPFVFFKRSVLTLPMTIYEESLYTIKNVSINAEQDAIVVTANHSQIYVSQLFAIDSPEVVQLEFKFLSEPLHIDSITDLSVCTWKPIAMTVSNDHTVRIWNYDTMKVELLKKFLIDIRGIALHPSGLFAAIAFTDVLRLVQVQFDDLKITKSFNYPMCTALEFSHNGHYLAAGCEKFIAVIAVFTFETVMKLKGHSGHSGVLSLAWSSDDSYLVSSGKEGSIYEWSINSGGERINELTRKGTRCNSVAVAADQSFIVGVTHTGYLLEIRKSQMVREFRAPDEDSALTSLAFSRSNLSMFAANDRGCLYSIKVPFLSNGGGAFTNQRFYHKGINRLCMTNDDKMLITVGVDGTVVFWKIKNAEGITGDTEMEQCDDVLISRGELMGKIGRIELLEMRLNEQTSEFVYQQQQGDSSQTEKVQAIHENYWQALQELKNENEYIQARQVEEQNKMTTEIAELNERHHAELEEKEADCCGRLIVEFENGKKLEREFVETQNEYEQKLKISTGQLHDAIESVEEGRKKQLDDCQDDVARLLTELKDKDLEFAEYRSQLEVDNERQKLTLQLKYEERLKAFDDELAGWRLGSAVIKKRNSNLDKESVELRSGIELLQLRSATYQDKVKHSQKKIDELRRELSQRDNIIRGKEQQIVEITKQTQELGKCKQALTLKTQELKINIEPRESTIREKKEQIIELERDLKELQEKLSRDEKKFNKLHEKYLACDKEVIAERARARASRERFSKACSDIFKVSGFIQKPPVVLQEEVLKLYERYANDSELKKTLQVKDDVQKEFARHCEYFEAAKQSLTAAKKLEKKSSEKNEKSNRKLMQDNMKLIAEMEQIRREIKEKEKDSDQMKSLLGMSSRCLKSNDAKMKTNSAISDKEEIEENYKKLVKDLEIKLEILSEENQYLMQIAKRD